MSKRTGSGFSRFRPQVLNNPVDVAPTRAVVRKNNVQLLDHADRIANYLGNLASQIAPAGASGGVHAPAKDDPNHLQRQAPDTLSSYLQQLIMQGSGAAAATAQGQKLTPQVCQQILHVCATLLRNPMRYDYQAFNKYYPGQGDHIDHSSSVANNYLKTVQGALALVITNVGPIEAKQLQTVLERINDKELDITAHSRPPYAAAVPDKRLSYSLGTLNPPHPMSAMGE